MQLNTSEQTLSELAEQLKDEELLLRLRNFEDNFVERKVASDSKDWIPTAVAFANSVPIGYPAVLFLGVRNDGTPEETPPGDLESVQKSFAKKMRSVYPPAYYLTKVLVEDGKQFLAIVIPGSPDRPHFAGPSFIRVGAETTVASPTQFDRLIAERQSKAYEISRWIGGTVTLEHRTFIGNRLNAGYAAATLLDCNPFYLTYSTASSPDHRVSVPIERVNLSFDNEHEMLKIEIRQE